MSITVKKATLQDGNILAELGAKTFYDTFRVYNTEEDMQTYIRKSYDIDLVNKNLSNNTIQYFIAYDEETPVGYTKLIKNVSNEKLTGSKNIELEKIYVLKEYFDKKVGKELMIAAIQY